jgi:endonuclease YncB( thermonuclease family)
MLRRAAGIGAILTVAVVAALLAWRSGLDVGGTGSAADEASDVTIIAVVDGDTIEVDGGVRVRLVQIDAPEVAEDECWAAESASALAQLIPVGTTVRLARDPALDDVDRYGRLLRYVHRGRTNVNLELVRRGAASVWFYDAERGRYADRLLDAAGRARNEEQGLWGACPATRLDPERAVDTAG